MTSATLLAHHRTPSGPLLAVVIALAVLYVAMRTGRLRRLRGAGRMIGLRGKGRMIGLRGELRELRIRPTTFLPLALLVIVVVVLLVAR